MATPPQAAARPVIAKAATVTNCDRVDDVMLNRIDVTNCDSGARSQKVCPMQRLVVSVSNCFLFSLKRPA
jgi:hypothetical protein